MDGSAVATKPHDFDECLQRSHDAHDLPIWETIYRQAFPTMLAMHDHRGDGYWQRAGIDRSVILASSKRILIDEKVRGRNARTNKVYDDIALEYVSNDKRNDPGWVEKPLEADYIAYAIVPKGVAYLLPVGPLQGAWQANKDEWLRDYGFRPAINKGYKTLFCPVPPKIVYAAIGQWHRVMFTPMEWTDA